MTTQEHNLIRRLAWLCDEMIAGNQFSPDTLSRWSDEAHRVLRHNENAESNQFRPR